MPVAGSEVTRPRPASNQRRSPRRQSSQGESGRAGRGLRQRSQSHSKTAQAQDSPHSFSTGARRRERLVAEAIADASAPPKRVQSSAVASVGTSNGSPTPRKVYSVGLRFVTPRYATS